MNSSTGSGLCPGLQGSNTPIVIQLLQKSPQETHQGKGLTKQTEAMTNEGEEVRAASVLGSLHQNTPVHFLPYTASLPHKTQKKRR